MKTSNRVLVIAVVGLCIAMVVGGFVFRSQAPVATASEVQATSVSNMVMTGVITSVNMAGDYKVFIQQSADNASQVQLDSKNGFVPVINLNNGVLTIPESPSGDDVTVHIVTPVLSEMSMSGHSDVYMKDIKSADLSIHSAGANSFVLQGQVSSVNYNLEGQSTVDAKNLIADSVSIHSAGEITMRVNAQKNLNVSSVGSGTVAYVGSPKIQQSGPVLVKPVS
jgi:hypothetical protein